MGWAPLLIILLIAVAILIAIYVQKSCRVRPKSLGGGKPVYGGTRAVARAAAAAKQLSIQPSTALAAAPPTAPPKAPQAAPPTAQPMAPPAQSFFGVVSQKIFGNVKKPAVPIVSIVPNIVPIVPNIVPINPNIVPINPNIVPINPNGVNIPLNQIPQLQPQANLQLQPQANLQLQPGGQGGQPGQQPPQPVVLQAAQQAQPVVLQAAQPQANPQAPQANPQAQPAIVPYYDDDEAMPLLPSQRLIKFVPTENSHTITFTNIVAKIRPADINILNHYLVVEADTDAELDTKLTKLAKLKGAAAAATTIYALVYDGRKSAAATLPPDTKESIRKAATIDLKARPAIIDLKASAVPAAAPGSAWLWRITLLGQAVTPPYQKEHVNYIRSELYAV